MESNPTTGDTAKRIVDLLGADTVLLPIPLTKECGS